MVGCLLVLGFGQASSAPVEPTDLVVTVANEEAFKGKGTDAEFPNLIEVKVGDRITKMSALGSGIRKKAIFKVYEAVAYADESAALHGDPYPALLGGSIAMRVVMYFVRDVGADKIQGAWEDGFKKYVGDDTGSLSESDRSTFISFFNVDMKKEQTIELTWLPDIGFFVVIAGQPRPVLQNQTLATAVFSSWFGDKPISKGLKKNLVRFVSD